MFLGAFLTFQIQPVIGKIILPWFGGSPAVWTICMLFFQVLLLAGYVYAHLIVSRGRPIVQFIVHGSLLLLAAFLLAFRAVSPEAMKPAPDTDPVPSIILILTASIGLPYFTLAATSPLVQSWYGRRDAVQEPYVLYAVSNIGSLLALVSYPAMIEPLLPLRTQTFVWSIIFTAFAIVCGFTAWISLGRKKAETVSVNSGIAPGGSAASQASRVRRERTGGVSRNERRRPAPAEPGLFEHISWVVLPMLSCMLLLAVTNQLCTDVSSSPFLWVLPLSIYLLTFALAFTGWRFVYSRSVFFIVLVSGFTLIAFILRYPRDLSFLLQIIIYSAVVYAGCTACHAELYNLRPPNRLLTRYYLFIAAGGAAGGMVVGLAAPVVFTDYYELHLTSVAILVSIIALAFRDGDFIPVSGKGNLGKPLTFAFFVLLVCGVAAAFIFQIFNRSDIFYECRRNFFGVVSVRDYSTGESRLRGYRLVHGYTSHGLQFADEALRNIPTAYFSEESGAGIVLAGYPRTPALRVGAVGMGVGTIAAYARPGDLYRFFEINPDIISIASDGRYFHYLEDAEKRGAAIDIVRGDGRLILEREASAGTEPPYDVIVLDAFSSDAIPAHLLTMEAFAVYFDRLKKGGVIAVHITNQTLDLLPVVTAIADHFGTGAFLRTNYPKPDRGAAYSRWVLLADNPFFIPEHYLETPGRRRVLWTDDFSNLWSVMR